MTITDEYGEALRVDLVKFPSFQEAMSRIDSLVARMSDRPPQFSRRTEQLQAAWTALFADHPAARVSAGRHGARAFNRIFGECLAQVALVIREILTAARPEDDFVVDGTDEVTVANSPLQLIDLAANPPNGHLTEWADRPHFIMTEIDPTANIAFEARRKLAIGSILLLQYIMDPPSEVSRDMRAYMEFCRRRVFPRVAAGTTYVHALFRGWDVIALLVELTPELSEEIASAARGNYGDFELVRSRQYTVRVFEINGVQYAVHTHTDMKLAQSIALKLLRKQEVRDVRRARYVVVAVRSAGQSRWHSAKAADAVAFADHLAGIFRGEDDWGVEADDGAVNHQTALGFFVHKFFVLRARQFYEERGLVVVAFEIQVTTAASIAQDREVRGELRYGDRHHVVYRRRQLGEMALTLFTSEN